jgi:hypothetical protein
MPLCVQHRLGDGAAAATPVVAAAGEQPDRVALAADPQAIGVGAGRRPVRAGGDAGWDLAVVADGIRRPDGPETTDSQSHLGVVTMVGREA